MKTHFWGPSFFVLAALPHMRRRKGGRVVNVASIGGLMSVPHLVPYSASKFALVGLSDGLRAELARENIRALPGAGAREGDVARPGKAAGPGWAPSVLLRPMHAAAGKNNEL